MQVVSRTLHQIELFFRFFCVDPGHGFVGTDKNPIQDPLGDLFAELWHFLALFGAEFAENVVDLLSFVEVVADAHTDAAIVLGSDGLGDVAQAVVAAVAAVHSHSERAEREIDVVANDDKTLFGNGEFLEVVPHGVAAEVHICRGLQEIERPALYA